MADNTNLMITSDVLGVSSTDALGFPAGFTFTSVPDSLIPSSASNDAAVSPEMFNLYSQFIMQSQTPGRI